MRVAVLYITDSDIYNYREDYTNPVVNRSDSSDLSRRFPEGLIREEISRLSDNLATAKAPVFIVHLELNRQRLNDAYQNGLLQLAETTGGVGTLCRTRQEIPDGNRGHVRKNPFAVGGRYRFAAVSPKKLHGDAGRGRYRADVQKPVQHTEIGGRIEP